MTDKKKIDFDEVEYHLLLDETTGFIPLPDGLKITANKWYRISIIKNKPSKGLFEEE